jgi:hypothetical protein
MYLLKIVFIVLFFFQQSHANPSALTWQSLSLDQQAELLLDLEYIDEAELPKDITVLNYHSSSFTPVEDLRITNPVHQAYVDQILGVFESEVSRESIEQSEYSAFGDSQISELYLILDTDGNIVAAILGMYQDGRDQDGNDSDVNWSARVRFNEEAEILKDDRGQTYDELYFEWSGH